MSDAERPMKRSEILAIENVKRIADQIRSERNDALALAQEMRENVEACLALLRDTRSLLSDLQAGQDEAMSASAREHLSRVDALISRLGA